MSSTFFEARGWSVAERFVTTARFVTKVTKRAVMPARVVTNEVVTNRAGIALFFSSLIWISVHVTLCVCVCVRACVHASKRERERRKERSQRERVSKLVFYAQSDLIDCLID